MRNEGEVAFPKVRMQRLRKNEGIRKLVQETHLQKQDFIMPVFINEAIKEKKEIKSLKGIYQNSLGSLLKEVEEIVSLGIKSLLLFGIPKIKDDLGSSAWAKDGIIQKSIRKIKEQFPQVVVICDCCLCEYTSHGHCGVIDKGKLANDKTLELLGKTAVSYAEAGADIVAPSGMMDGMVRVIRDSLDQAGFQMSAIMSYAAKYASNFYGPFREAAGSKDNFTDDRKHHQINPAQRQEAIREAKIDQEEGADYLMVKPAGLYLDIIRDLKNETSLPLVAYQVSGEYAMLIEAAKAGIIDEKKGFEEQLIGMKRAGANLIISYYAKEIMRNI